LSTISTVSLCLGVEAPIQNINYHPKQKQEVVSSFTNVKLEGKKYLNGKWFDNCEARGEKIVKIFRYSK
jgi:hypothetical protein